MWKSKSRQRQIHCTNKCGIKQNIGRCSGHRPHTYKHTHTHDDTHVIVMGRGVGKVLRYDTAVRTLRSFFIRENIRLTLLENGEHICPWTAIIVIVIGIEQDWLKFISVGVQRRDDIHKAKHVAKRNKTQRERAKQNTCYMVRIETIWNVLKLILFSCPAAICKRTEAKRADTYVERGRSNVLKGAEWQRQRSQIDCGQPQNVACF